MAETTVTSRTGLSREVLDELSRRRREPAWLHRLRQEAFDAYEAAPLPGPHTEGWRRTSLAGLDLAGPTALPQAVDRATAAAALRAEERPDLAALLTLQDGARVAVRLDPEAEQRGVRLLDLWEALEDPALAERVRAHFGQIVRPTEDKFTALHYAFMNAGVVVHVPRGVVLDRPIQAIHGFTQPELAAFVHSLVLVDESAQVALVEGFVSGETAHTPLASGVTELVVGPNAQLRHVHLQRWWEGTWSFSWQRAHLAADAHLRSLNVALGARLARTTVQVVLEGNGGQADLLGVVAGTGRQHVDFQTLQEHVGSATRSDLVFHNALRDRSSSNFTGLIRITRSSRQTESSQEQKNFLLSPRARADSDPKLEILNNDVVRCTHGAAVGPVDPEMIFYLQSRGLDRATAERLVVEGFFQTVLDRVAMPALASGIWSAIQHKLGVRESTP